MGTSQKNSLRWTNYNLELSLFVNTVNSVIWYSNTWNYHQTGKFWQNLLPITHQSAMLPMQAATQELQQRHRVK
jgi:hypothetical protein